MLYVHVSNQVVATVDETNPLDQVVPPRQDGLSHDLAAYISCKTSKLALPNDGKQVRCLKFEGFCLHVVKCYCLMCN